ncbi:hypothetical protein AD945_01940 [Gluconobacter albidus]|uniref:Transposase n=1 Tax=Gluconobacter albidus TaxID=318683 RepID=A0A149TMV2_9PROT|nr:hypothetical protein AD945_01940 [Gluconobacter albidus]
MTNTEEFRREAVRIALSNGLSLTRVAADLGIGKSTLGHWVSQYRSADVSVPDSKPASVPTTGSHAIFPACGTVSISL